ENDDLEVRSECSYSSRSSSSSKVSLALATARAKAKAAEAKAAFAQKEVDMKVRRARIDAELAAMEVEKEREAAFAEAAALEEALEDNGDYLPRFTDLAKFLARSQLITTGLTKFDDKVENYWAWKSSFSNAVKGLELTEAEELDLLVKWLGRESSEHVRRIKSVHIRHPAAGLKMAWDRLEQCYGTPEAIESALFARLESFPKISSRDVQKLRDLADLLLEIEAAKEDRFLPGLSYLDTARGIHPILEKLPYHLQDKWTSFGFKY
ncbi:hypothetical protein NFI96_028474, partial [Prochilodus magdalenae]